MISNVQPNTPWRGPCRPCAATAKHETSHKNAEPPSAWSHSRHHISRIASTNNNSFLLLIVSIILICFSSSTTALEAPMPMHTALKLASFADSGILLVDPRPNPRLSPNKESIHDDLRRRKDPETSTVSSTGTATTLITTKTSTSASTSSTSSTTTSSSTSLPSPFDSSLLNNFTVSSCPTFIKEFISTAQFQSCQPFSLLLQTSTSFFKAQKSPLLLTQTLDASCAANVTECTDYLNTVANNLTTDANCKADFELGNPTVVEAKNGLIAYQTLYEASCLHNSETSSYCAVDAFTNTSSPTDSYVYYLPLGMNLPGGSTPTCDACLDDTMLLYQKASANRSQPIFETYASAAQQINLLCGPKFTNASIPAAVASGASMTSGIGSGEGVGALILVLAVALWMF